MVAIANFHPKQKNPNEIRFCVDMREPNKAILRSRHITPTLDDMILDLNGSKVFSKMDLLNGYHQLELIEDSRNITTFTTHVGLRRYKRLSFGVSSAAEIFQNTVSALEGLDGTSVGIGVFLIALIFFGSADIPFALKM
jgi:hypothetical protein